MSAKVWMTREQFPIACTSCHHAGVMVIDHVEDRSWIEHSDGTVHNESSGQPPRHWPSQP